MMSAPISWHPAVRDVYLSSTDAGGCLYQLVPMTASGDASFPTGATPCSRRVGGVGLCRFWRNGILAGILLLVCFVAAGLVQQRKTLVTTQQLMTPEAKYAG